MPQHAIDGEKEKLKAEKFETDGHREESAVKRATMGMLRKGSLLAVTENALRPLKKPFDKHVDETLTPEQREEKQRKKMERDLACRKEKVSFAMSGAPGSRPHPDLCSSIIGTKTRNG